jgi:hypothetical protein
MKRAFLTSPSKTEHEHGESQGESETRIPLMTANEIKLIDKTKVFVEIEGIRSILVERLDWRNFPVLVARSRIPPPDLPTLPPLTAASQKFNLASPVYPIYQYQQELK